ncbi:50S ribosomal protein L21 [Alphaproteobacteria bacterium]|jgi:large subunit ribosomal protein L21|nr:50S ribosomal protein L21 [Alphaproteobacteria bacterium]MDB2348780.1 50S ribosomal protein L21 [Alphaproteobacteria bacterium]
MLAVFKTGGKQYSVKAGQILKVEKLEGKKGDSISFKDVLAVSENTQNTIGSPLVEGAVVEAKILDQIRDKKIIVFKKRKRQNYRSTQGHRQYLTVLKIETISMGGKKSQSEKKETKTSTPEKKVAVKKKAAPKKAASKETAVKKTAKKKTTTPKEDK